MAQLRPYDAATLSTSGGTSTLSGTNELASPSPPSAANTYASTSSLPCPVSAAQGTQLIAGAASSSAALSREPARHKFLHIPAGTFQLCLEYRRNAGKCNNPQCHFLHVCPVWLAGYAPFQKCVLSSNLNTDLHSYPTKTPKEKTWRKFHSIRNNKVS